MPPTPTVVNNAVTNGATGAEAVDPVADTVDTGINSAVPVNDIDREIRHARSSLLLAASNAALVMVELITTASLVTARGVPLNPGDPARVDIGSALTALHKALHSYDTLRGDGWTAAMQEMESTAGAGISTLVQLVVERLHDEIAEGVRVC